MTPQREKRPETGTAEETTQPIPQATTAETERKFSVDTASVAHRLDQFLTAHISDVSRARVQQLIEQDRVRVIGSDGAPRPMKASGKLRAGDTLLVTGEAVLPPLRAQAEAIPLAIVYEDEFLAVINKPAGMMVHAGAGATDSARNRGTLVNALLHHMATLSTTGGDLRPGIVHRLDKQTSGLILVAKNDRTHRRLSEMFARRDVHKTYIALVHGAVKLDRGTLDASIGRDPQRRTRMTTRRTGGRTALSHYTVRERFESRYGQFTLLDVEIESGRTHQIRVHLSSIGHPVVGDTLYGAPHKILPRLPAPATKSQKEAAAREAISLERNFLHAARLQLKHPDTGEVLTLQSPIPAELKECLERLKPANMGDFVPAEDEFPTDKIKEMMAWIYLPQLLRRKASALTMTLVLATFLAAFPGALAAQNAPAKPAASSQTRPASPPQQNSATKNQNGAYTITTVVNEVNLLFTVTDKHGHFIRNLKESDFSLLDDRMPPAEVYSFTQQTNLPLRVGLMIDTSSSIRTRFQFEQNAAIEFLLSVLRPQIDQAFVMGFDVTPEITQGFSNNGDLLSAGIRKLSPGGGTALYDAVYTACRDQMLPLRGAAAFRKVIILLSDGEDDQSHATLDDAVKMCQRAGTTIYTISTNNSPSLDRGDKVLSDMAVVTGGRAFYPMHMENVSAAFQGIQEELRSQYSLVYKPADFKADGAFRPIFLTSFDRKYKVRAMKGYFAPSTPQ